MASTLSRLGTGAFRRRKLVVAGWVLAIVVLGGLAAKFYQAPGGSVSIPGTSAQKAIDQISTDFPGVGQGSGRIVFHTDGKGVKAFQAEIDKSLAEVQKVDGVTTVVSPFVNPSAVSADQHTAYAEVGLAKAAGTASKTTLEAVDTIVADLRTNELQVEAGGDLISRVPGEIIGVTEIGGLILALVVLLMTLGSLVAAGMPVLTALTTVAVSMAGLFALSRVLSINSTTPALAVMLGLAVGIDYSLFIISKYRSLLIEGYAYEAAVSRAIGTAGNAVVFAAATVIIALSALTVVRIPFMTIMGLSAAATVAVAALVAITLIPAMLGFAGDKIFTRKVRAKVAAAQARGPLSDHSASGASIWHRWGAAINHHPVIALALSLVVVGALALPAKDLALGLPTDQYAGPETSQRKAYNLLSDAFGVGFNAPLIVLATNVPPVTPADAATARATITAQFEQKVAAATAAQTAEFTQRQAAIRTPADALQLQKDVAAAKVAGAQQLTVAKAQLEGQMAQFTQLYQLNKVTTALAKAPNVKSATPAKVTADGSQGIIQVIPDSAPSSTQTVDLIAYIREHPAEAGGNADVGLAVTGTIALQDDINTKLSNALPVYLLVIVGLSLVLLMIAFRSILIPIKATFGFLLSLLTMFGVVVAVFQWGWFGLATPGPIVSFVPIIGIGVLFGLAMDYEFFLVSSMHEAYSQTHDNNVAIVSGFGLGAKVVTAAAVIMVAVFAGFIGNNDTTVKAIGFALAVGIFVDAFVVRMTFVPAVMTLVGKNMWWLPKWLDRLLPHVSIDGSE